MMRPRIPTSRTQPPARPVYEDFQPKIETTENPEAHFLHIYLPGFTKERVRITYVNSSRMVRVTGETPINGVNRWSRFNQTYVVPENCEVEKLQGKFDQGTLTVTMPKKFLSQVAVPKEEKIPSPSKKPEAKPEKAQEMLPPKSATARVEEPRDKKSASLSSPVKGTADRQRPVSDIDQQKKAEEMGVRDLIPPESTRESKPQNFKEETVQKPTLTTADARKQKGQEQIEPKPTLVEPTGKVIGEKPQKGPEEFDLKTTLKLSPTKQREEKPQKGQEEFGVKPKLKPSPPKQMDERVQKGPEETRQRTTLSTVPRKQTQEKTVVGDAEKERTIRKEVKGSYGEPSESRKPKKGVEKSKVKEKESKENNEYLAKVAGPFPPKISEREKETAGKASAGDEGKHKEDMIDTVGKGIKDVSAATSMAVARIKEGTLKDEEKNLLVNMGAAVMVIAALGVYVSYRFASSGKP